MTTKRRWAAALLAAAVGCASPVARNGVADGAADADAVVNDGGQEDRDARVADASGDAGDADAGDAMDAAEDVDVEGFDDVADAAAEASVDAGPPTMRLTFVGGALRGSGGGMSMRAAIVWHGAIRGQSNDGGITFRGWFR